MRTLLLLALTLTGCLRSTEYRCALDTECGAGGSCDPRGYCSFADGNCDSGQRFGDSAGSYAGQCTTPTGDIDAGIDMALPDGMPIDGTPIDMMVDGPPVGCPSPYAAIAGGQAGHVYRVVTADDWTGHRDFCAATSPDAYLAIPDDVGELGAIATLAAQPRFWVGVTDSATEDTWLTVLGDPQTFLPWETGAPDDAPPNEDCVEGISTANEFNDERCTTQQVAVCECVLP